MADPLPRAEQLARVNQFFNEQIRAVPDIELWGVTEYWATPMETLAQGAGGIELVPAEAMASNAMVFSLGPSLLARFGG